MLSPQGSQVILILNKSNVLYSHVYFFLTGSCVKEVASPALETHQQAHRMRSDRPDCKKSDGEGGGQSKLSLMINEKGTQ